MRIFLAVSIAAAVLSSAVSVRAEGSQVVASAGTSAVASAGAVRQSIPVERLGPPVRLADQCGATEYSCDDIGFPVCVYDASEEDYMCVPRNVIVCADNNDWDWWCKTDSYCCDPRSCCK